MHKEEIPKVVIRVTVQLGRDKPQRSLETVRRQYYRLTDL